MSAVEWLLAAGTALLAAGTLLPVSRGGARCALLAQMVGTALIGLAGALVLFGAAAVGSDFEDTLRPRLGVDPLTGFFLVTLATAAVPALAFARDYFGGTRREPLLAALTGAFVVSLILVLTARDPTTFLAGWELMTLAPAAAILVRRTDTPTRHAVFVYVAVTHIGGAGVWISLLAIAHYGALGEPGALLAAGAGPQAMVIVAALIGFGTKAGLMPLHAWLPRAHPVAPSPFSALMSGVMVKVALYGLVRVLFEWAAPAPLWAGLALLGLGLLSALAGALYALTQRELKRLLAFSTIENVGIAALGLGVSVTFAVEGKDVWAALAFAAALLHVLNHAVFKSLLFLAAGSIERAAGSIDLDRLGGLLGKMPWTGGAFLVGAAAIAGLPPLNGFVSEWMILQALVHAAFGPVLGVGLAAGVAAAGLAATAAIAGFAFLKAAGLALLGAARTPAAAAAREVGGGMRLAPPMLAAACVALAAVPGLIVSALARLAPTPYELPSAPGLALPGTGSLPSPWLLLAVLGLTGALWLARGSRRAAPGPAWACGQRLEPALAWTSAGFAKPLQLVLEAVLRPRREIDVVEEGGMVRAVSYRGEIPHHFDTGLYGPARRAALRGAGLARRIQSGSVRAYAAYLLALLLVLMALVRTGALG